MSQWTLRVGHPEAGEKTYVLEPGRKYTIGRNNCDVDLSFEPHASRRHAVLEWTGSGWKLVDELSANGTKVGGKPVNFAEMAFGVEALIGRATLSVSDGRPAPVKAPAPAPEPAKAAAAAPAAAGRVAFPAKPESPAPDRPSTQQGNVPAARPRRDYSAPAKGNSYGGVVAVGVVVLVIIAVAVVIVNSGGGAPSAPEQGPATVIKPAKGYDEGRAPRAATPADELGQISAISDPAQQFQELENFKLKYSGRLSSMPERHEFDQLHEVASSRVRSAVAVLRNAAFENAANLEREKQYVRAKEVLETMQDEIRRRGPGMMRTADQAGVSTAVNQKIAEYTASSKVLYDELIRDAASSERIGFVQEAIRLVKSIAERCIITDEDRKFVEKRIVQLETRPDVQVVQKRWKPGADNIVPWDPNGRKAADEPESKPTPGDPAKPAEVVKKRLPPNPLFPLGRISEEEKIFGVLETVRVGIEGGLLSSKIFKRGKETYEIQSASEAGIRLKSAETGMGVTVPWAQFTPAEYELLLNRVKGTNPDTLLGLALLAFERNEVEFGRLQVTRLVGLDPSRKTGVDILLAAREGRDEVPEGGYVMHDGLLVHPEVIVRLQFEKRVRDLLAKVERGLGKKESSKAFKEGEAAFQEILGLGPDAAEPTIKLFKELRQKLMEEAEAATGLSGDTRVLDQLFEELQTRRKHALELIFDEQKWPYPYGPDNDKVTQEVMDRVNKVREIWNDPASVKAAVNPKFEELVEKVRGLDSRMDLVDPAMVFHEQATGEDIEYLRQISNQKLSIKKYGKSRGDKTRITGWYKVIDENERIEKENEGKAEAPDKEAWQQLRVTNDYRMMMGRHPLKMNFKLYWAAKHHSQWCVEHNGGRISHDSPGGPRGNNVPERCAHEGYSSGTGENIHMNSGQPTPESAHDSWLHSSGHHRNILSEAWVVMGNGRFATIWTQNFGGADEGKGNQESKGGK